MAASSANDAAWNAIELGISTPARTTLPLYWSVADAFRRKSDGWGLSHLRFGLRRSFDLDGTRWVMSARLGCSIGPLESGTGPAGRLLSLPYVHLWGPQMTPADRRRLARKGAYDRLAEVFTQHGYEIGWGKELGRELAWARPWPHAAGVAPLLAQRAWLEDLFCARRRDRPRVVARPPDESLWAVLGSFRGDRAGPWFPVVVEFNTTRSLDVRGATAGAPQLTVRVDRWDAGGPVERSRALARVGVEFFARLGAEDRRLLRRRRWFSLVAARLAREGFRGEWFRSRNVQPLGRFSRRVTSAAQVVRERTRLAAVVEEFLSVR